ncbi:hypothetical protein EQG49_12705 [Periweissella cryptocerci]|uniref:Uncharacterized protein n=1 Tax=Periweissella cryptocerci TaxID=2506420 RepID=A0A4P6YWP6_9LACO|nr:hypothetical protein [Periweissella cryptocerci]QBO37258.1 hypothetical protein EQG49_12705 [Periweissella cryptocerci]
MKSIEIFVKTEMYKVTSVATGQLIHIAKAEVDAKAFVEKWRLVYSELVQIDQFTHFAFAEATDEENTNEL